MNRAVFLDRDGVINRAIVRDGKPFAPLSIDDFEIIPRVADAVTAVKAEGFRVIVVTNQPDVGNGIQRPEVIEEMHSRLRDLVPVDDIYACYHTNRDGCTCRKPKPGMLIEAANKWSLDLRRSYMVGDRWGDVEAGRRAGCRTILVEADYEERRPENPDKIVSCLFEASKWIFSDLEFSQEAI